MPYYVGSDPNEQAHAFVRTSQFAGRRKNLDCSTLGYGLEKLNVRSSLPGCDKFQEAHTRGRTVCRMAIPLKNSDAPKDKGPNLYWYGKDINRQSLRNSMKNGTRACIDDCKQLNFPFFMDVVPDKIPKVDPLVAGYVDCRQ